MLTFNNRVRVYGNNLEIECNLKMKEIISIVNQKGGFGKTTTAHVLGAGLSKRGFKILFVDLRRSS
ncbi:MAG: hypothetical protein Nk1A_7420 [Endomicrobiia bacterium]|nr:MAG: hypothetical protein Nk1A_7420 [Endomicrobiia bacterium]